LDRQAVGQNGDERHSLTKLRQEGRNLPTTAGSAASAKLYPHISGMLKIGRDLGEVSMIAARIVKIVMVTTLALFAFLVTFGNVTDYDANFRFVRHVLSMDTTYPDNPLSYRAITNPVLWHFAYGTIIFGEGLTCAAFIVAAVQLTRSLRSNAKRFRHSKRFVFVGAGLGFLVWFFGFMVIGGEWFAMWQSQLWNGQQAAFRFYMTLLGVLVFVNQEDSELSSS
jgi:predicted small integral membrane protein